MSRCCSIRATWMWTNVSPAAFAPRSVPKRVDNEYDENLNKRKAIYVKYAQAVPLKYAIDDRHCIYLTKGKCGNCKKVCPAGAIHYEDKQKTFDLRVGSVVLAVGGQTFDPRCTILTATRNTPTL